MTENVTPALSVAAAVQAALHSLSHGRMVVVTDDADRENEGDLVMAAQDVTAAQMAFMVRHTTGIICTPMPGDRLDALRLPQMVSDNTEAHATAFTVSVDHLSTSTGVSADDRAWTVRALADPRTTASDLRRPGHVFPLRYRQGGVLRRAGHTEAAVDLLRLAGLNDVAVIGEIVGPEGDMARGAQLLDFAAQHELPVLSIADLVRYRSSTERLVELSGSAELPTLFGKFRASSYRSLLDDTEHLALVMGDVAARGNDRSGVLVRVHSECLTGDIMGSLRCDCGTQFEQALQAIAGEGCGALVYLRGQEGRGIGLGHKLRAYALQEQGRDTVDANTELGLPVDSRSYGVGAQILADLGVRRIRLITNNPAKYGGLQGHHLEIVSRVTLPTVVTADNVRYLRTKRDRLGHDLGVAPDGVQGAST
jgi:3,4-dihydroxy 2-butanone 4-phosphate synthase/GTP cyclohydrolase II